LVKGLNPHIFEDKGLNCCHVFKRD